MNDDRGMGEPASTGSPGAELPGHDGDRAVGAEPEIPGGTGTMTPPPGRDATAESGDTGGQATGPGGPAGAEASRRLLRHGRGGCGLFRHGPGWCGRGWCRNGWSGPGQRRPVQAEAPPLLVVGTTRPVRARPGHHAGDQDLRGAGVLHPVLVDGEHPQHRGQGPGQQAHLPLPLDRPRRRDRVQRGGLVGSAEPPAVQRPGRPAGQRVRARSRRAVRDLAGRARLHQAGHRGAR